MRQSQLFTKTLKNISGDITSRSHELLYKSGFIRESVSGRYYFLPLGMRVHEKIVQIIEEEMNKAGAQQILAPTLHQLELWKETNRTNTAGFELMKVKDRRGSEFALGGTAEEMIVDLVRKFTVSYKDLPFNIYQFSNKFRDELRARGGLLRTREFIMKDAYSFHADEEDFKREYQIMWDAYVRIFNRLGLKTHVIESDNGYIGGEYCHEFIVESDAGESKAFVTEDGSYAAHEEVARFKREEKNISDVLQDMKKVEAVRGNTMEDGVMLHSLPLWQQMKSVLYKTGEGDYVMAVLRGDLSVNEVKLGHVTGAQLTPATEEDIRSLESEPGFISPVGIDRSKMKVIGDTSLRTVKNMYTGANAKHRDLLNVNIDRDYSVDMEADIALADESHVSEGGGRFRVVRGIEVGNIFQLGHHYSKLMNATFTDEKGQQQYYYMGCYGIGIGRTLATIVETLADDKGMIWPESVAPFRVHLVEVKSEKSKVKSEAKKLYEELIHKGVEVLWDDRDAGAGEKFADADLIGIPFRVVVSERSLDAGGAEIKKRTETESRIIPLDQVAGMCSS